MKRKILITAAAICMAASSFNAAYASNIKTIINNGNIEYTGTVAEENIGKNVFLEVFKKGYEVNESNWETENPSNIIYINTKASDKKGNYTFKFKLTENGLYPMVKNEGTENGGEVEYIGYTNSGDFRTAIEELSGKTESEIPAYIDANKEKLAMYSEIFNLPSDDVKGLVKKSITRNSKFSDLVTVYVAEAYSQNRDVALNEYINDLLEDDDSLRKYYKNYNEALYSANLKQDYTKTGEFHDKLVESVVLVYKNDGVSEVTKMLNEYASKLGITKKVTDTMTDKVVGEKWIKDELVAKINALKPTTVGGGSSSSWGGGSINNGGNTSSVGTPMKTLHRKFRM